eukprot:15456010-Alexandrium_andersonii.AAC.1
MLAWLLMSQHFLHPAMAMLLQADDGALGPADGGDLNPLPSQQSVGASAPESRGTLLMATINVTALRKHYVGILDSLQQGRGSGANDLVL